MFFNSIKYNLSLKVIIIFILIILLSLISYFIISYTYNIKSEIHTYKFNILKLENLNNNLEKDLRIFINSNHESEFYEIRDDKSLKKLIKNINLSSELTDKFKTNVYTTDYENKSDFNEISNLLNLFFEKNNLLVNYLIEIGFDEFGYIEELIYTENKLRKKVELFGSVKNKNEIKSIINLRKGFINNESNSLIQEFQLKTQSLINSIQKNISDTLINNEGRKIIDALNEYIQKNEIISRINKKIGLNENEGLQKDLYGITHEIQILLKETRTRSEKLSKRKLKNLNAIKYIIIILYITMSVLIVYLIFKPMYDRYLGLKKYIKELSEGVITPKIIIEEGEFTDIMSFLKFHSKKLQEKNKFIINIRKENLSIDNENFTEKDEIGRSLNDLKDSLIQKQKTEKENIAERKINDRMVSGLAMFSNILRQNANDIEKLTYEIVFNLIEFMSAVIGGIYILDESDNQNKLELHSSYAYNEKKLIKKEFAFGEGLIGTCAVDKATLYFETIPEDYIKIVSGFIETTPNSLLIVPLVIADKTYGVIELASLKEFSEFDIKFLESLGEDIASTLSYIKTS